MQNILTALDSQSVTYLMEALSGAYHPNGDHDKQLREQRIALARLFMYWRGELRRGPTVDAEIGKIQDPEKQRIHENVCVRVSPLGHLNMNEVEIRDRAKELGRVHPNKVNDCMIVAEAEGGQINWLVSYDTELRRRLGLQTRIEILQPVECWERAKIPRGSKLVLVPFPDTSFAHQTWWRWDKI